MRETENGVPPAPMMALLRSLWSGGATNPMNFEITSEWGVECRTPRCSGFAVQSRQVLKDGIMHPKPAERGIGTCEVCGCQYSLRPEQLKRRLMESRKQ